MGTVVFSVDAELANDRAPTPGVRKRREGAWLRLIECFETYDVPATWAIVGRLLTDRPVFDDSGPDGDMPAFAKDQRRLNHELVARDLVQALIDSDTDHDIGCHSFGHQRFTHLTRDGADAELSASARAFSEWDVSPNSFVFPFNAVAHRDLLADHGYTCYRGRPEERGDAEAEDDRRVRYHPLSLTREGAKRLTPEQIKRRAGRVYDRLSEAVKYTAGSEPPRLVKPTVDSNGLVAVPASMPSLYRMPVRLRRTIRSVVGCPLARIAKLGVDAALQRDGVFHCWFHPGDFHSEADFQSFESVLSYVTKYRDEGVLRVKTMSSLAEETLAEQTPPRSTPEADDGSVGACRGTADAEPF